jgi:hypothetical protein
MPLGVVRCHHYRFDSCRLSLGDSVGDGGMRRVRHQDDKFDVLRLFSGSWRVKQGRKIIMIIII